MAETSRPRAHYERGIVMGIATFALLLVCLAVWWVFRNNYHNAVIKYWQRRHTIAGRKRANEVYRKTFEKELRQCLKDTGKDKAVYAAYACGVLFILAIVFFVINYWIKPAGLVTKLMNWAMLLGSGAVIVNGWLGYVESAIVADEKGFKKVRAERAKNQQLLARPAGTAPTSASSAQPASGIPAASPAGQPASTTSTTGQTTPPAATAAAPASPTRPSMSEMGRRPPTTT